MRREAKIATRVVSRALRVGGRGARSHLRKHMRASGLGRMSKVWRYKFYPGRRGPMSAAAFVYVRGRRAKEAVWAFENGAVIRPQRGRYLAIPTGYNKQGGYRKSKSGPLVTVEDMIAAKGMTFTKRTRNGLLWFMRVTTAQEKNYKMHTPSLRVRPTTGAMVVVAAMSILGCGNTPHKPKPARRSRAGTVVFGVVG
jgi:hypothetical protein